MEKLNCLRKIIVILKVKNMVDKYFLDFISEKIKTKKFASRMRNASSKRVWFE